MPIYFRNAPVREPFIYDSIGNRWLQDATSRPNGYPFYHYLQTESGCGRITIQGKSYLLHEQEGVLIIRHGSGAFTNPDTLIWPRLRSGTPAFVPFPEQSKAVFPKS